MSAQKSIDHAVTNMSGSVTSARDGQASSLGLRELDRDGKSTHASTHPAVVGETRFGANNYAPLPVVLARGRGAHLFDVEGRRYLDMMSAYSAASFGHLHPRLVGALKAQLEELALISRVYHSDNLGPFCEELAHLTGLDVCLPMNTGAEAVETAIKAARRYGQDRLGIADGKVEIIVAEGNFHGRTTTVIGFSSEAAYRRGFGPFTPGFVAVPYGDASALEAAITPQTAAVLIEPIQGEAGIVVPPPGYLAALRRICSGHGILLIFDEVQSGFGRTGRTFCFEHEAARPDGLVLGKALGGGLLPVSALVGTHALMSVFDPGSHGSTFGGNPLAIAVAREAMRVLADENLAGRSADLGILLLAALRRVDHPAVIDTRGKGLWVGVELDPALVSAKDVCQAMARRGVLTKETHETVIRFAPPLIVEEKEILEAVAVFHAALEEVSARRSL